MTHHSLNTSLGIGEWSIADCYLTGRAAEFRARARGERHAGGQRGARCVMRAVSNSSALAAIRRAPLVEGDHDAQAPEGQGE
jgi:hypothetical protein